jgi:hypothetical protein
MAYDEHWADGTPGPIASLPWFASVLRQTARHPGREDDRGHRQLRLRLATRPARPRNDLRGGGAHCQGIGRQSPARSGLAQPDLRLRRRQRSHPSRVDARCRDGLQPAGHPRSLQPRGVALWRLGSEDPALWQVFGKERCARRRTRRGTAEIRFAYGVDYEGKGEILEVTAQPQIGSRIIEVRPAARADQFGERFTAFRRPTSSPATAAPNARSS